MKTGNYVLMLAATAAILLVCGCAQNNGPVTNVTNETRLIGGDRDVHGCLGPAGYSWNASIGACVREWELDASQRKAAGIAVAPLSYPVTVVGVDSLDRCMDCYVVRLQRNDNQNMMEISVEDWKIVQQHETQSMSLDEAMRIAAGSDCVKEGKLLDTNTYNSYTHTWWIDLDAEKKGCSPACVVSEDTRTAGINWRCTGLITPDTQPGKEIESFDDCVAAGYPIMESNPRQCSVPGDQTFTEKVVNVDVNSVVAANNQFALDLYSKYKSNDGNVFFSPYSISTALAMTYEGARGQTADEMQSVLHFPKDDQTRRNDFAAIYAQINRKDKNYTLSTANALWAQKDYYFLPDYLDITGKYYGGNVTNLDYVKETEKSRLTINSWVENQTNNKIKDLIPQGEIDASTRLVLTNAVYFKGTWVKQFDKNNTHEQDFRVSPGTTVKAQMMSLIGEDAVFNYTETDQAQILELPYAGNELSMLILLPKGDDINSLEESLSAENLAAWKNGMSEENVNVYLPKYKFETKYSMTDTLKEMGMPTAFSGEADFSGMTGKKDLFISDVIHQAYVEVNEEGTEAAAATAVIMANTAVSPTNTKTFNADHPFVFLIQDKTTGAILFMGRVNNPTK